MAKSTSQVVRVVNISTQRIDLQIQPPGGDFYLEQRQVRLMPTKSVDVPVDHLNAAQLENYKARHQIQIIPI
jgi:hypothetical protein